MSKILKNTSLYTLGNVLPQLGGFILLPIYSHYLTPGDYGIVSSMQVLVAVFMLFFTLALDRSIYRLYFDYKTEKEKRDYLGTVTISMFLISCIFLLLLFVFKEYVSLIYKNIDFHPYYSFAILTAFFTTFSIIPKIYFQVNEKAGKFVLISISQFILNTSYLLWFIVFKTEGAAGMLKANMLAAITLLPILIYISIKIINFTIDFQILKKSLFFSAPIIPGIITSWILSLSDRIFIERYINLSEVGIYSVGSKISALILILSSGFYLAYNPFFFKIASSESQLKAKKKLAIYNNYFSIAIISTVFIVIIFSKEVIYFLLDEKYFEAYKIVPIIGLGYLISNITGIFNLMIYQEKKVIKLMWISIIAAPSNLLLNFILIPNFGINGAAVSTLISFFIVFLLTWKTSKEYYYIPLKFKQLGLLFMTLMIIFILFNYVFNLNMFNSLCLKILMVIVIVLILIKRYSDELRLIIKNYKK